MKALEYTDYRNFLSVISKAKIACENSNQTVQDHFVDVTEKVFIGYNIEKQAHTIFMTPYACYLAVQNSAPSKTIVAQAQTYFAIQTRIAEVKQMQEYEQLNRVHYEVGAKVRQTIKELGGTMPENLPTVFLSDRKPTVRLSLDYYTILMFIHQEKCHYYEFGYIPHYYNDDTKYIFPTDFS